MHLFGHFPEPPCWIKGEKFTVEGLGVCGSRHQCSGSEVLITPVRLKRHDWPWPLQPHLSSFRGCMLTTWEVWNGCTSPCINFWGNHSVLNTDAVKPLAFLMQGTLSLCYPTKWTEKNLLSKLTGNLSKNLWEGTGFSHPLQCEGVKLFIPPSMSDAWHKSQNSE